MNAQEAVALCRLVRACCPQQKFDEATPDVWAELLKDIDFDRAKDALVEIVKTQPFVAPSEIRAQVAKSMPDIRSMPYPVPPASLADHPRLEARWIQACRRHMAQGLSEAQARERASAEYMTADDQIEAYESGKQAMREIAGGEF